MVAVVSKLQISLDFEPALTEQFRTLKQVCAACVYGFRGGLGAVAIHCDLSPSALSRMLNENEDDPRHLPVDLLTSIIEVTQDYRPIHWLIAKFLPSEEVRARAAVTQLESVLPQITAALAVLQKSKRTK
jgi:hypothetical protein